MPQVELEHDEVQIYIYMVQLGGSGGTLQSAHSQMRQCGTQRLRALARHRVARAARAPEKVALLRDGEARMRP